MRSSGEPRIAGNATTTLGTQTAQWWSSRRSLMPFSAFEVQPWVRNQWCDKASDSMELYRTPCTR